MTIAAGEYGFVFNDFSSHQRVNANGHQYQFYISTEMLGSLLERRGWRQIGEAEFLNRVRGSVHVREF